MQTLLAELMAFIHRLGPIPSSVIATLLVIFGLLIIAKPALLGWIVGILLILTGVAILAGSFSSGSRGR